MTKTHSKRRKVIGHSHSRVFIIFFQPAKAESNLKQALNEFTKEELVNILRNFYIKARSYDGKYYSRNNSMRAIRTGLNRYLNKENISFSIITDTELKPANEALNGRACSGRKNVFHQTQTSLVTWRRKRSSLTYKNQKVYCKQPGLTSCSTLENAGEKT